MSIHLQVLFLCKLPIKWERYWKIDKRYPFERTLESLRLIFSKIKGLSYPSNQWMYQDTTEGSEWNESGEIETSELGET